MNNRLTEDSMDRRFRMFLFGANGQEIALCFDKTRQKLIMGGAKPSKVAGQYEEQVRFMARLRNKHRDMICTWFRENCHFDGIPQFGEAIQRYRSLEEVAVLLNDDAKKFWRTVFREYVQLEPDPLLDEFLSGGVLPNALPSEVASVLSLPLPAHDIDAFLAAARGECDDIALSQPFPAFLLGVAGILRSESGLLETVRESLSRQGEAGDGVKLGRPQAHEQKGRTPQGGQQHEFAQPGGHGRGGGTVQSGGLSRGGARNLGRVLWRSSQSTTSWLVAGGWAHCYASLATSAADALKLLAMNPVQVVVSDHRMPEMTGIEFLSRVKELYPDTVRIILSGYADLDSVIDAINRGAVYRYFTKPWDDEQLRECVQEAFRHQQLLTA
eukprot:gene37353-46089_t